MSQIDIADEIKLIPIASHGINKDVEPTQIAGVFSPDLYNFSVKSTKCVKRPGFIEFGSNLPLFGTGMDLYQFIDITGTSHLLAFTTTDIYKYDSTTTDASGSYIDKWLKLTPSVRLQACDDKTDWTAEGGSNITIDDSTDSDEGITSIELTFAASVQDKRVYCDFAASDISVKTEIGFWIKSSIDLVTDDLRIYLSEDANGVATNAIYLSFPPSNIRADTWKFIRAVPDGGTIGDMNAVVSIGIWVKKAAGLTAVINIDDIRVYKPFSGSASDPWTMEIIHDTDYGGSDLFGSYDSALLVSNGVDNPMFWTGASDSTFFTDATLDANGVTLTDWITNFTNVKQIIASFDHLIFANVKTSTANLQNSKILYWTDIADMDNFEGDGTNGNLLLTDAKGAILRTAFLGNDVIVYNEESITTVRYVGGDLIFIAETFVNNVGLFSKACLWIGPENHVFLGTDHKIYFYAGRRHLTSIGQLIEDSLFDDLDSTKKAYMKVFYNSVEKIIYFFYAKSSDTYPQNYYAVNIKRDPLTWERGRFSKSVMGYARFRNIGAAGSWRCNGPYLAETPCSESTLRCDDGVAQEGFHQTLFISNDGYVFAISKAKASDNGTAFLCRYDTEDITVIPYSEFYFGRITEFSMNVSSGASASTTVTVYYSIDSGKSWAKTADSSDITVVSDWSEHRIPFDIKQRKVRFRVESNNIYDLQIRGSFAVKISKGEHR